MSAPKMDSSFDKVLLAPYEHILQVPGKKVRSKLSAAFNHWLNIDESKAKLIGEITQMLHNASLLIDDIEDNSQLRRGIPVAHSIFGIPTTLNSANYVYFLGLEKALQLGNPDVSRVFAEQLIELHRGQGMDIYWRDAYVCPTEDEYKVMVIRKTGGLFGLAVRLMQLFSENKSDFKPLTDYLGLYFQIRDDYANLNSKEYENSKSYCEDLSEGKFSFPIIHAITSHPDDQQIMNIVRQRTDDVNVKRYCVVRLEQLGSFAYTRQVLVQLEQQIADEIRKLGGNPYIEALMEELKDIYRNGHDTSCS